MVTYCKYFIKILIFFTFLSGFLHPSTSLISMCFYHIYTHILLILSSKILEVFNKASLAGVV